MASIHDIMTALKTFVVAETAALSTAGCPRTVILGWPSRNQLHKLLQCGQTVISIFAPEGSSVHVRPYSPIPVLLEEGTTNIFIDSLNTTEFTVTTPAGGSDVDLVFLTDGNPPQEGDSVLITIPRTEALLGNICVHYVVEAGDTLSDITLALKDLINTESITGVTASVATTTTTDDTIRFTVDGTARYRETFTARTAAQSVYGIESLRQKRSFQVDIWAPSPTVRAKFGAVLESAFGLFINANNPGIFNRLDLPGDYAECAFMEFSSSYLNDDEQLQKDWRQTFILMAEWPSFTIVDAMDIMCVNATDITVEGPPSDSLDSCLRGTTDHDTGLNGYILNELEKITVGGEPRT